MQLSTGREASTCVFRSEEEVLGRSLRKDELFENGEKDDVFFDMSSQLVLEQRCHSGSSEATRRCLKNLRKSDDDCLATVFRDEICFRRKMSGFHVTSLRRMIFQRWKTFAEDSRVMRLRSDEGLKSLLFFLHGLTPEEREDVLPLLVQARRRVEDTRIRKEEIRKEKCFAFRSQLLAESSTRKKKEIVDDWLNLGPAKGSSEDEIVNGLFLREKVQIDDEAILIFLRQKIHELEKTAAVWKHDLGKRFLWVAHGEHGLAYSSLDTFEDIWSQVFTGCSSDEEVGGFFIPGKVLRDTFVFIGVTSNDIDDMDFLFEGEGVWMPLAALEGLRKYF